MGLGRISLRRPRPYHTGNRAAGFTLVELLIVMGLFVTLSVMVGVNIMKPQAAASLDGATDVLVADLRSQQAKAIAGEAVSGSAPVAQGMRFVDNASAYTQFKGTSYNAGDTDNFTFTLDGPVVLTTTFPSDVVVFNQRSGEVAGWTGGQNTITVRNTSSNETKTITLNRYGVPTN